MKVLLDHCLPRSLARLLIGHEVWTTRQMGWDDRENGDLLALAAPKFDVFLTIDKGFSSQQAQDSLPLPVIALAAVSNSIVHLKPLVPELLKLLGQSLQRRVYVVGGRPTR